MAQPIPSYAQLLERHSQELAFIIAADDTVLAASPAAERYFPAPGAAAHTWQMRVLGTAVPTAEQLQQLQPAVRLLPSGLRHVRLLAPQAAQGATGDVGELLADTHTLRATLAHKDAFLSFLLHNIKNPLTAILAAAAELPQAPQSDIAELAEMITSGSKSVLRTLAQLAWLAAHREGRMATTLQPVDLAAIAHNEMEQQHAATTHKRQRLHYTGPQQLRMLGDAEQLAWLATNLLENAQKYAPAGSCITLSVGHSGSNATLQVHNTGTAIPAERLQALQAGEDTPRSGGWDASWGVGLTVVRHVVTQHGGLLEISSDAENGTRFTATLPLHLAL